MWEIFFFKNHEEIEAERQVPDLIFLFKKALHKVKACDQHFSFNISW